MKTILATLLALGLSSSAHAALTRDQAILAAQQIALRHQAPVEMREEIIVTMPRTAQGRIKVEFQSVSSDDCFVIVRLDLNTGAEKGFRFRCD